jgi:O-Antigen ligase
MPTLSRQAATIEFGAAVLIGTWAAVLALAPSLGLKLIIAGAAIVLPLLWWSVLNSQLWLKCFFATAILLPPLPVLIGERSPHLSLFWAFLGILIGALRFRRSRSWPFGLSAGFVAFTAALLVSLVPAAIYSGPDIASASFARILLFFIGPYVFFYILGTQEHSNPQYNLRFACLLFGISVAAALFACLDFYFQFPAPRGYGPQFVWLAEGVFRRAQGLFYEASTLGNFCVFFLVMIAVSLFRPPSERPCSIFWLIAGGTILGTALIFSYSRASLLNLLVSVCVLACLNASKTRRRVVILVAGAAASAVLADWIFPSFVQSYWTRLTGSVQYFWSSPEGVLSGRVASWRTLTEFIAREPWNAFFGIGYKTLPYSNYVGSTVIGDNTYLTLFIETGFLGLLSFVFLNIQILRHAFRAARSPRPQARFFGMWMFCFWIGELVQMLSGDLITYWRVLPIYFWTLAVAIKESGGYSTELDRTGTEVIFPVHARAAGPLARVVRQA